MVKADTPVYQTYKCPIMKRKRTRPVRRFRRLKLAGLLASKRRALQLFRGVA